MRWICSLGGPSNPQSCGELSIVGGLKTIDPDTFQVSVSSAAPTEQFVARLAAMRDSLVAGAVDNNLLVDTRASGHLLSAPQGLSHEALEQRQAGIPNSCAVPKAPPLPNFLLVACCYQERSLEGGTGVDGVTWKEYETGLEGRLADLHSRVLGGAYRAQPSRRATL